MKTATRRLQQEYRNLVRDPSREFVAAPVSDDDLFTWHFTIKGTPDTPFQGGVYHGKIVFPPNYPYAPPDVVFLTPSGRFETNKKICLNFTSYHPDEWSVAWDIRTALTAIVYFLPTEANGAVGGIEASDEERKKLARESRVWKCKCCNLHIDPDPLYGEGEAASATKSPEAETNKEKEGSKDECEESCPFHCVETESKPEIIEDHTSCEASSSPNANNIGQSFESEENVTESCMHTENETKKSIVHDIQQSDDNSDMCMETKNNDDFALDNGDEEYEYSVYIHSDECESGDSIPEYVTSNETTEIMSEAEQRSNETVVNSVTRKVFSLRNKIKLTTSLDLLIFSLLFLLIYTAINPGLDSR